MATFSDSFTNFFKKVFPSPFTIAVLLTLLTMLLALLFGRESGEMNPTLFGVLEYWGNGMFSSSLLEFTVQMMLMLVLGHVLALSGPVSYLINSITKHCTSTTRAAYIVTLITISVSLINWGLGLIFGAILARKVAENAAENGIKINYPLIGAAGYSGLMVWHGGLSGSAPIKAAESGHLKSLMSGIIGNDSSTHLPNSISLSETVFSNMNMVLTALVLLLIPLLMLGLGKWQESEKIPVLKQIKGLSDGERFSKVSGAEVLDRNLVLTWIFGLLILTYAVYISLIKPTEISLAFVTPNFINLSLFSLCLLMHGQFSSFLKAVDEAISGTAGILIQFPLYFGIMGIMKDSGLISQIADFFVSTSTQQTYPILTFISASIVNIFVPSGGGQWVVQGPIVIKAAVEMGIPLGKPIMALAYGDQLTNMMQPFWALPLLGITGLSAKEIIPYSFLMMLGGFVIFGLGLWFF